MTDRTVTVNEADEAKIIGYRCMKDPDGGVIPLSAYSDPCPHDVAVYEHD